MKILLKLIYFALGYLSGAGLGSALLVNLEKPLVLFDITFSVSMIKLIAPMVSGFIFGLIFLILIPLTFKALNTILTDLLAKAKEMSVMQIILVIFGLILGLVLAALVTSPIYKIISINILRVLLTIIIYGALGYLGVAVMLLKSSDIEHTFKNMSKDKYKEKDKDKEKDGKDEFKIGKIAKKQNTIPKILDTSVIIDGRIFDILKTGFVDGPIVVPTFVLDELRYIADSADSLKRVRGRRGLDILNQIQNELTIEVQITDKDYPDIAEVDIKLLKLAGDLKGKVVTNDFNLNKVAVFRGVPVLNTNELTNAVKSIILAGEQMTVQIIKEGKEATQGVAYMDDGTMIVVENGKSLIGHTVTVEVTSVLQTSAGKMIFAKSATAH